MYAVVIYFFGIMLTIHLYIYLLAYKHKFISEFLHVDTLLQILGCGTFLNLITCIQ